MWDKILDGISKIITALVVMALISFVTIALFDALFDDGSDESVYENSEVESVYYEESDTTTYQNTEPTYQDYTVYYTDTGSKYHRYGCQYLHSSCYACYLSEAQSWGLTPCSVCDP